MSEKKEKIQQKIDREEEMQFDFEWETARKVRVLICDHKDTLERMRRRDRNFRKMIEGKEEAKANPDRILELIAAEEEQLSRDLEERDRLLKDGDPEEIKRACEINERIIDELWKIRGKREARKALSPPRVPKILFSIRDADGNEVFSATMNVSAADGTPELRAIDGEP
jgi:hypothetical protein